MNRKIFIIWNNHPFSLLVLQKIVAHAIQNHFGLSDFQILVLTWLKGVWTGILLSLVLHYFISH